MLLLLPINVMSSRKPVSHLLLQRFSYSWSSCCCCYQLMSCRLENPSFPDACCLEKPPPPRKTFLCHSVSSEKRKHMAGPLTRLPRCASSALMRAASELLSSVTEAGTHLQRVNKSDTACAAYSRTSLPNLSVHRYT